MKKMIMLALSTAFLSGAAYAVDEPLVGGAPMYPSKSIIENASQAENLTTLVSAVKQVGLVDTLSGEGPFTIFAPTNRAFEKSPTGTLDDLIKADDKAKLKQIVTYHIVPGKWDTSKMTADLRTNNGKLELRSVEGTHLSITEVAGKLVITDAKGEKADITTPDVHQSNGVVHVIDQVLMPGA
jgi:uncharacterized surface protein with fasciclin (FAS1) repeats